MRGSVLPVLLLALAAAPGAARAQDALPPALAERVNRVLNDAGTDRRDGASAVAAGEVVAASLGVMDGSLEIAGEVEGDVVVVNGDLRLAPGAAVGGEVIVLGGRVEGAEGAAIGAGVRAFDEPVAHCRRAGMVDVTGRCAALPAAPAAEAEVWGTEEAPRRLRWLLATGRSYNRVEGLPVRFGLAWESRGPRPTALRAEGIYRTESGARLGPTRWGYAVRAEQAVGRAGTLRVGVRAHSLVDAIEERHVTDLENSLSTFFLKRDFRDHFERQGWVGYAALRRPGSPWSGTLEVARERHRTMPAGSPPALFRNAEPWRPQPLVGEGVLVSATASVRMDTRSESWDPAAGWFVSADVEQALRSTLRRMAHLRLAPEDDLPPSAVPVPSEVFGRFTRVHVDVRRYNRISPSSRLNLRAAAGGALTERGLPPQRQHALGGEGTLAGYPLFSMDCGARDYTAARIGPLGPDADRFYEAYGCDRFLLAQVEYRSDLAARIPLPSADGEPSAVDARLSWIVFADAAAGWSVGDRLPDERAALDVGTGMQWGDFGVYAAFPVGARARLGSANLFVRLAPRF